MQAWIRNGTLLVALSSAGAHLLTGCGASQQSGTTTRVGDGGDDGAGGAADVATSAGASGEALLAAGASGSPDESIPLDEVARPMLEAQCERLVRCGDAIPYEQVPGGCVGAQLAEWQAAFEGVKDEIAKGSVVYDAAAASACIEARRSARCDDNLFPRECEATIDGTRRAGEACDQGVECVGDLFCTGCPGECTPPVALGEPCGDGRSCAFGLACLEGRCIALRSEGESCDVGSLSFCAGGEHCSNGTSGTAGVCQPKRAAKLGQDCGWELGLFCELGSACVETERTETGTRERCVARSRSGGTCWRGMQDSCPEGEFCPLSSSDWDRGQLTAKCRPLVQAGERCPTSNACAPGTRCLFGDVCVAPRAQGEACNEADECSNYKCAKGQCAAADDSCVAGDPDGAPLLHDPPRPAEQCPTEAPVGGERVQGFDSSNSVQYWSLSAEGVIDWTVAERFSCSGALHLHAALSESSQFIRATSASSSSDRSQRTRLHLWLRLGSPGVGGLQQLLRLSAFASVRGPDLEYQTVYSESADASWLRDFAWHEFVIELGEADLQFFNYGIEVSAVNPLPDSAPTPVPEIDLYVDDVWLE